MRYLEKGKISLILNNPQAISALRATGNSPASLLWLLHPVLWTDLQHLDSFSISLAGHYGATLGEQLCVLLFPWSHPLLWPSLSRAGSSADSLSRTGEGMGRGAATCWGCCFLHCFSTWWCTPCTLSKWAARCEGQKLWLAGAVWDPGCISQGSGFTAHVWNHLLFPFVCVSITAVISDTSGHLYCTCFFLPSALQHLQRE